MRSTSILWPEADLGCPLRSSFVATVKSRVANASLNPPITTYTVDQVEERRVHECGFLWSLEQLDIFEEFHRDTLLQGMKWFMMPFLVSGRMIPCYSHIIGGYRLGDEQGHVTCSFTVDSFSRTGREL